MVTLQPEDRVSFSWTNADREKQVKFLADGYTYWSAEFELQDAGVLSVQNLTASGDKRFFKVTKKNLYGSVFIIIEDLVHPPYLIDNKCSELFATCIQKGYNSVTLQTEVAPLAQMPFAWSSQKGEQLLQVTFYYEGKELRLCPPLD